MPELLFVLVLVKPVSETAILTYAAEYETRSECHIAAHYAKKEHPDIAYHTCTMYKLIKDEDDTTNRSTDE